MFRADEIKWHQIDTSVLWGDGWFSKSPAVADDLLNPRQSIDFLFMNALTKDNNSVEIQQIGSRISERVGGIIEQAKHTVAVYLNSEISMTYWQIGKYLSEELDAINDEKYGSKIVSTVSRLLTERFGKGYMRANIFRIFFVMRAYATDEDWSNELHAIIREDLIANLNRKYDFYRIRPKENPVPFVWTHFHELIGKAYRTELLSDDIILAFENTDTGRAHKAALDARIKDDIIGEMQKFDLEP